MVSAENNKDFKTSKRSRSDTSLGGSVDSTGHAPVIAGLSEERLCRIRFFPSTDPLFTVLGFETEKRNILPPAAGGHHVEGG